MSETFGKLSFMLFVSITKMLDMSNAASTADRKLDNKVKINTLKTLNNIEKVIKVFRTTQRWLTTCSACSGKAEQDSVIVVSVFPFCRGGWRHILASK